MIALYDEREIAAMGGSFWKDVSGKPLFSNVVKARAFIEEQALVDADVVRALLSPATAPVYHNYLWYPLTLRREEAALNFTWPVDFALADFSLIADGIGNTTKRFFKEIDVKLRGDKLTFGRDPFIDEYTDELHLWVHDAKLDLNYLNDYFGTLLDFTLPSSYDSRELLKQLWDCKLFGSNYASIKKIIAVLNGVSLSVCDELVSCVCKDRHGIFVGTDKRVYRASADSVPVFAPGMRVDASTPLFDNCYFFTNSVPAHILSNLPLGKDITQNLANTIFLPNRDVEVLRTENSVRFEIGGSENDISKFWQQFDARLRFLNVEMPESLLSTVSINPCTFVLQEVFGGRMLTCVLKNTAVPDCFRKIDHDAIVRACIPPGTVLNIVRI